jgi:hypothetical protein
MFFQKVRFEQSGIGIDLKLTTQASPPPGHLLTGRRKETHGGHGIRGLGMVGLGETLGSPWLPLAIQILHLFIAGLNMTRIKPLTKFKIFFHGLKSIMFYGQKIQTNLRDYYPTSGGRLGKRVRTDFLWLFTTFLS